LRSWLRLGRKDRQCCFHWRSLLRICSP
jgi:hypothetical protein